MESKKNLKILHRANSYIAEDIFHIYNKKITKRHDSKSGGNHPKIVILHLFLKFHGFSLRTFLFSPLFGKYMP